MGSVPRWAAVGKAPVCVHCGLDEAMREVVRVHQSPGDFWLVLFQCESCKRLAAESLPQTKPAA